MPDLPAGCALLHPADTTTGRRALFGIYFATGTIAAQGTDTVP